VKWQSAEHVEEQYYVNLANVFEDAVEKWIVQVRNSRVHFCRVFLIYPALSDCGTAARDQLPLVILSFLGGR